MIATTDRLGRSGWIARIYAAFAYSAAIASLWSLTHRYTGISRDAELYAFQAMAKIHPNLKSDLYLASVSQDDYSVFSSLFAWFIDHMGLQPAALALFLLCTGLYLCSAYIYSRSLVGSFAACLSVAALVIVPTHYGGRDVFSFTDDYLTARTLAVALVAASLALQGTGHRWIAGVVSAIGLLVHPLMALPGAMLLLYLWLPLRRSLWLVALGCVATLCIAVMATASEAVARHLVILDPAWLEVVRERSEFLFLTYWRPSDWELAARPFLSLTLTALVIDDVRVRKLCVVAMLLGVSGLLVAAVAGSVGPVAVLLQGQAWRWVWVSDFVAILLFAPTAIVMWRDRKCGPLSAILLLLGWGWTYSVADNLLLIEFAMVFWLIREQINDRTARLLRWTCFAIALLLIVWLIGNGWSDAFTKTLDLSHDSVLIGRIREFFSLGVSSGAAIGLLFWCINRIPSKPFLAAVMVVLLAVSVLLLPHALKETSLIGSDQLLTEFEDWRSAIPPNDTVLQVPVPAVPAFAWFALRRPNYLSVDQSAGVVFSRKTAMEVRRRAEFLLPIVEPDWRVLSNNRRKNETKAQHEPPQKPLTAPILASMCSDPALGFVATKENLGFSSLRHSHPGPWDNWNLYDCRVVRGHAPGS